MTRLLPVLLLCGCSVFRGYLVEGGVPDETDFDCGQVRTVSVRVTYQAHYLWSCEEARAAVDRQLVETALHREWVAMVGLDSGCIEWGFENAYDPWGNPTGTTAYFHHLPGCTYSGRRIIALVGLQEDTIRHEFGHAQDFEEGRPNERDPKNRWLVSGSDGSWNRQENRQKEPEEHRDVYLRDDGSVLEIRRSL